jgi:hypothetical protein
MLGPRDHAGTIRGVQGRGVHIRGQRLLLVISQVRGLLVGHTVLRGLNPELMSRVVNRVAQACLNVVIYLINGANLVHRGVQCLLVIPLLASEDSLSLTIMVSL